MLYGLLAAARGRILSRAAWRAANKAEIENNVRYRSLESDLKTLLKDAKDLMRRARDKTAFFEALEGGIERAVIDNQHILRLLLDGTPDPLSMLRTEDQRSENQEVQRTLEVGAVFPIRSLSYRHSTQE